MKLRKWATRVAVVASVVTLGAVPASAASAYSTSVSAKIVKSICTISGASWQGGYPHPEPYGIWPPPKGTVKFCAFKLRIADDDPNGDYYAVVLQSMWTLSNPSSSPQWPARMYQSLESSRTAIDGVYSATRSFTSNKTCSTPLTIGLQAGPVSATVAPEVCSGFTVSRLTNTNRKAQWTSPSAAGLTRVETMYMQKVTQNAIPYFYVNFAYPTYINTFEDMYWTSTVKYGYRNWSNF